MWLLPISVLLFSVAVAFPLGWYLAWIMDGHYRAPQALTWCERRVNSGPQNWKQYTVALLGLQCRALSFTANCLVAAAMDAA